MSEQYFYHYTNLENSKDIFLEGKILPSLKSHGDAVHGDGVYLTTLDPKLGKDTVGKNNWDGVARAPDDKMESYFEILMPSDNIRRAKVRRDIHVFNGELVLSDYKWSLKTWSGDLLATQHYMVRSHGKAAVVQGPTMGTMGRYTLCSYIVTCGDKPVYKHDQREMFLFYQKAGWSVGDVVGLNRICLLQKSPDSPSPHKTIPWQFASHDKRFHVDETLMVHPCY